jgi:hypothetical protein
VTTSDITAFLECQAVQIRALEANVTALTEELESERAKEPVHCEYRGFEFWLTELDPGYVKDAKPNFGYNLRRTNGQTHLEGGGAYATKHEATCAAFARIETLSFDR